MTDVLEITPAVGEASVTFPASYVQQNVTLTPIVSIPLNAPSTTPYILLDVSALAASAYPRAIGWIEGTGPVYSDGVEWLPFGAGESEEEATASVYWFLPTIGRTA